MTLEEFERITADVRRAASEAKVDLADAANPYTVWLENPIGSGHYFLAGRAIAFNTHKFRLEPDRRSFMGWKAGKHS
jgi:hypothetical protein